MKITLIAGARPNFMKIAPIVRALDNAIKNGQNLSFKLVHTGQHYDDKLSQVFFDELRIPQPNVNLGVGSGTQAEQTAKIMIAFERFLFDNPTDIVVVVGDVNSTMACTIVAKKLGVKVAHVEGGIRSWDMSMPEEVNRIVTDSVSDYFFTTSLVAGENLRRIGVPDDQIFFVGNTMIDSLLSNLTRIKMPTIYLQRQLKPGSYYVMTLHRPSNVDDASRFSDLMRALDETVDTDIVFPVHPRTRKQMEALKGTLKKIIPSEPVSYLEFIFLIKNCKGVITDSGGVQEETTVLGIPCLTLRKNTERPETVTEGTNEIVGEDIAALKEALIKVRDSSWKVGRIPALWDGRAAERIVEVLCRLAIEGRLLQ
ncbi:MAG: non-hydrolyzing UDP-N-acetylglucosamine 2-epimerase [Cyclobacteriaceae bacterium]